MAENASLSPNPEDVAAAQARRRKERREAKIKASGSTRLNKISGLGGGIQRGEHSKSRHLDFGDERPTITPRPTNTSSPHDATAADAHLRQLLLAQQQRGQQPTNPFPFGDGPGGGGDSFGVGGMAGPDLGGNGGEGVDGDPLTAMLSQMMLSMGGAASGPGGQGGPGSGFPGMPGMPGMGPGFPGFPAFPGMGPPGQQQQALAKPSKSAALWRLVHFAVAVALGLYVALATPFTGTRIERDAASAEHAVGSVGVVHGPAADNFALQKRYFFYAFATAETILLTSRLFLERDASGGSAGSTFAGGIVAMAMGFLPPAIKRNVEIAMRYWQIFGTVRSDLLVCVFVLGVCSWLRS
ncbi:hypothetical protein SPBR_04292 [Sporothrix brasiliensis 5110]|uniref:Golgi to ER traffic protein 2 n=1 Tax=Sporothrix brasiliensis 5110 TaxID=1398154 RepID=A0A0C2FR33_9PEZI|nr:uncharacterized protein SPBR_04292 [Sporothrix brasiliensis 5110]KIH93488.1 hypothetical protein SPBR_04292 [Sporothrix brasiliensis 5110]